MRRALAIDEASFGPDHPGVAIDLSNLARLLQATNRLAEAEPLSRRQLAIFLYFTSSTGHEHPHQRDALEDYAGLLKALGKSHAEVGTEIDKLLGEAGLRVERKAAPVRLDDHAAPASAPASSKPGFFRRLFGG